MKATAAFWFVLIGGTVLRFVGLGDQSLWWDEAWQHYLVAASDFEGFWSRLMNPRITLNPPLFHIVSFISVHAISRGGEITDWGLRAPSAVIGVLDLPLVYALGRRLFPRERSVALAAMAVMAFAPFHVHYSQEARMYTLVMAWAILSTLALLLALRRRDAIGWALYALTAAGSMYTHVHMLFGLIGHALWILAAERARVKAFGLSALAGAVLFLPMAAFFIERIGNLKSPYGGAGASLFSIPYAFFVYSVGLSMGPSVPELKERRTLDVIGDAWLVVAGVALLFGGLLVVGYLTARRRDRRTAALLLTGLAAPLAGVSLAALLPNMTFNVRYTAWGFPFFCLLMGLGVVAVWRRSRRSAAVVMLAIATCFAFSNVERHKNPRYAKEDVRGAVDAWRAEGGESLLFSYNGSPTAERYLSDDEEAWHVPIYRRRAVYARMSAVLSERATQRSAGTGARAGTVHVLLARDWGGIVEAQVREHFEVVRDERLPGAVSLLTVRVPTGAAEASGAGAPDPERQSGV